MTFSPGRADTGSVCGSTWSKDGSCPKGCPLWEERRLLDEDARAQADRDDRLAAGRQALDFLSQGIGRNRFSMHMVNTTSCGYCLAGFQTRHDLVNRASLNVAATDPSDLLTTYHALQTCCGRAFRCALDTSDSAHWAQGSTTISFSIGTRVVTPTTTSSYATSTLGRSASEYVCAVRVRWYVRCCVRARSRFLRLSACSLRHAALGRSSRASSRPTALAELADH